MSNQSIREIAKGKWRGLLPEFGVSQNRLTGKHTACPMCGGNDRFRFDDKNGVGDWICSHCGSGDGVMLATRVSGMAMSTVLEKVKTLSGALKADPIRERDAAKDKEAIEALWKRAKRPADNGPVAKYLIKRFGQHWRSNEIREVMDCWEAGTRTRMPAMVAAVRNAQGYLDNCHLTYLTMEGDKVTRRVMPGSLPEGCAIRLWDPRGDVLGIAEGIETAMGAARTFKMPVWAAINANRLAAWQAPEGVREVFIFGDNDESFTGQAAAYNLARRLKLKDGLTVHVMVPDAIGSDWAD